jgi:hypothetical protein
VQRRPTCGYLLIGVRLHDQPMHRS